MSNCYYLIPQHEPHLRNENGDFPECLRKQHHDGDHLCLIQGLRGPQYICWSFDYNNGCECEKSGEECECFLWHPISDKEAKELLAKDGSK